MTQVGLKVGRHIQEQGDAAPWVTSETVVVCGKCGAEFGVLLDDDGRGSTIAVFGVLEYHEARGEWRASLRSARAVRRGQTPTLRRRVVAMGDRTIDYGPLGSNANIGRFTDLPARFACWRCGVRNEAPAGLTN